jgi:hypothetical protein
VLAGVGQGEDVELADPRPATDLADVHQVAQNFDLAAAAALRAASPAAELADVYQVAQEPRPRRSLSRRSAEVVPHGGSSQRGQHAERPEQLLHVTH